MNHYQRVKRFMEGCGQVKPIGDADRLLRARLTLEEALEKIDAMGIRVESHGFRILGMEDFHLEVFKAADLVGWIDGFADLSVVNTGDMVLLGLPDEPFLELVDENNLQKLEKGHIDQFGKLIKPVGHKAPDIANLLANLKG